MEPDREEQKKPPTANISRRRHRRLKTEEHNQLYYPTPDNPSRCTLLPLNRVVEGGRKDSHNLSYSLPTVADQQRKEGNVNISAESVTRNLQDFDEPGHSNTSSLRAHKRRGISLQTLIGGVDPSKLPPALALEASTFPAIDHMLLSSSNFAKSVCSGEANSIQASFHYQPESKIETGKTQNPPPRPPKRYKVSQDPAELWPPRNRSEALQQDSPNLPFERQPIESHPTTLLPDPFPTEVKNITHSTPTRNSPCTWQMASQSLIVGPKGRDIARLEDCLGEDVPIRAVLFGWDALGELRELPPFWRNIRQLDEKLLFDVNTLERLAIFRIMHLLMRFHCDPSSERASKLPPFFNSKGLDFEADYYIGNYLPWPAIRELAKNPSHTFRSSAWLRTEVRTLKVLWSGGLHDCYTRCPETGLFKVSSSFDARLFDINSWTFGPEMFESFPMTYGVAPAWNSIPASLCGLVRIEYRHNQDNMRSGLLRLMKEVPVDPRKLKWKEYQTQDGRKAMYFTLW